MHGQDYVAPDFDRPELRDAPDARFEPAPADGVFPEDFFSSTNLPTYVKVKGQWKTISEPRMDAGLVLDDRGELWAREGRLIRKGQMVAIGSAEDGSEGIFVHATPFFGEGDGGFNFMSSEVSREKPIDYAQMAHILVMERERIGVQLARLARGPALGLVAAEHRRRLRRGGIRDGQVIVLSV